MKNFSNRKGNMLIQGLSLAIAAIVGIAGIGWAYNEFWVKPAAQAEADALFDIQNNGGTTVTTIPPAGECVSNTQPSLTLSVADKYSGNSMTNPLLYRIVGQSGWTTVGVMPTTITGSAGTQYEFAFGVENTSVTGVHETYTMPCESYPKHEIKATTIATPASVSVTVKNPSGSVNANATPYDVTAGDVRNFKFQMTGQYQRDYGALGAGSMSDVLVCMANTTAFSAVSISGLTPALYVPNNATLIAGTANTTYAWDFPVITSNGDTPEYTMTVTASSSAGAMTGVSAGGEGTPIDIYCRVYDSGLYRDSTYSGNVLWGVQDEVRGDAGMDNSVAFQVNMN